MEPIVSTEGISTKQLIIGGGVLVVVIGISIFFMGSTGLSGQRDQITANVESIRAAQQEYFSKHKEYIGATWAPRDWVEVNPEFVDWTPSEGFRELRWSPDSNTAAAAYRVSVHKSGFTVEARSDLDGDGHQANITATESEPATIKDTEIY